MSFRQVISRKKVAYLDNFLFWTLYVTCKRLIPSGKFQHEKHVNTAVKMYAAISKVFLEKYYILWCASCVTTICCVSSGKYIKNFLDRSEKSRYNNSCSTSYFETDFHQWLGRKAAVTCSFLFAMKKKIAIKATPHKINKHALCNTAQSISKKTYLCEVPFCVHKAEFFDYYLELEE